MWPCGLRRGLAYGTPSWVRANRASRRRMTAAFHKYGKIHVIPLHLPGVRRIHTWTRTIGVGPAFSRLQSESDQPQFGRASVSTESCDSGVGMQCLSKCMDYCDRSAGIPNWDILLSRSRLRNRLQVETDMRPGIKRLFIGVMGVGLLVLGVLWHKRSEAQQERQEPEIERQ